MSDNDKRKRIIAFLCNWCAYRASDLAGTSRLKYEPDIRIIRVMCSGQVDPILILKVLLDGAEGVLVGGCEPGDCHYSKGNFYARRRVALAKILVKNIGLNPDRIRLSWIPASESHLFVSVINEFTAKLKEIGDNPTKGEVYL
jgi:F420-non-reducing hydrogenase iron-sulfur subunit